MHHSLLGSVVVKDKRRLERWCPRSIQKVDTGKGKKGNGEGRKKMESNRNSKELPIQKSGFKTWHHPFLAEPFFVHQAANTIVNIGANSELCSRVEENPIGWATVRLVMILYHFQNFRIWVVQCCKPVTSCQWLAAPCFSDADSVTLIFCWLEKYNCWRIPPFLRSTPLISKQACCTPNRWVLCR